MFKTLKSKIIITAIILLTFLMFAFGFLALKSRMYTKQLMVQNYKFSIKSFAEEIDNSVLKAEDNLKSLALIGGLFYKTDRSYNLTNRVITRIFENYPETLGGGIWFKPYSIDKSKKYVCFYAFRDKNNKIVIDENFSSAEYDYPNQDWYKQIISQVTPDRNFVWTRPYYENQGSYTMMVTVGTGIYVDGELVGIATVDWELSSTIEKVTKMKPEDKTFSMYKKGNKINNSFALFGDEKKDYIIALSDPYLNNEKLVGHSLKEIPWFTNSKDLYEHTYFSYNGKKYIPFVNHLRNGMILIICIPKSEVFKYVDYFYIPYVLGILLFIFSILALTYYGMNRYFINPIEKLINIAHKISNGEDVQIKIEKPAEFAKLASTYDKMTKDIKKITKDTARINSELAIAKSIQTSSLPDIFPPFPDRNEFDIYASMVAAKEVGGDFYDFYFIDEDKFMFLIADVSGKGVPAALFMMTAKTLINNTSQLTQEPKELIKLINNKICANNKHGFFITMFAAIVDIKTGEMSCINCGHNPPLIKQSNGEYKYLEMDSNCVLGIFENAEFNIYETQLQPGDTIFTYTDGVTEALNIDEEMYGEDRLLKCINSYQGNNVKSILDNINDDVHKYADSVIQSDDITMLVFKYGNDDSGDKHAYRSLATPVNYKKFYTWLHQICEELNLNEEIKTKLDMCAEEIYANIQFYAYGNETGTIEVCITQKENSVDIEFQDSGTKYNPLEKEDPDITLPPEERPIGGLGIFMVKQMADSVKYDYRDGKNILTITLS